MSDPKPKTLTSLLAFFKRKPLIMMGLGFSSGLPFLLIFDTLSAWLEEVGVTLTVIGFFVLATFAYTIKFMWAPIIDRINLPFLTKTLGHRRSFMLLTQGLIMVGLMSISLIDPKAHLWWMAMAAVGVGFISATQDIVIDAWRIEAVETQQSGIMAASYQWGYRIAFITAGVVPFALADILSWSAAYALMGGLMSVGIIAVLCAPREAAHQIRPIHTDGLKKRPLLEGMEWVMRLALILLAALCLGSGLTGKSDLLAQTFGPQSTLIQGLKPLWEDKVSGGLIQGLIALGGLVVLILCVLPMPLKTRPSAYFKGVFVAPMQDFLTRYAKIAYLILALICFYRISEFVLSIMNPFYLQLGFSKLEIAGVRKVFGMWMSVIGVGLGGWVVVRFGLKPSLLIGALASPLSHLGFMYLAVKGHSLMGLSIAIGLDNIAASIQGTILIAYMSSLTSPAFTAAQYALFSSLYSLLGKLIATQSGRIVDSAALVAHQGGWTSVFKPWFDHLPPETYAKAAATAGISPQALGAGYMTYLIYTMLIGLISIGLSIWFLKKDAALNPKV